MVVSLSCETPRLTKTLSLSVELARASSVLILPFCAAIPPLNFARIQNMSGSKYLDLLLLGGAMVSPWKIFGDSCCYRPLLEQLVLTHIVSGGTAATKIQPHGRRSFVLKHFTAACGSSVARFRECFGQGESSCLLR